MLITHVTDTHIVPRGKQWLDNALTSTDKRLSQVVDYLNHLNPIPNVVIFTGDLTDDGSEDSYRYFRELVAPLKIPYFVIPGNHDSREGMRSVLSDQSYMPEHGFIHYSIENDSLRLLCLDTLVEGEDYGQLCAARMSWLKEKLQIAVPTFIFMHHPPCKVGMKLFDTIGCVAPEEFYTLVANCPHLVGIATGHYHHLCVSSVGGKNCFLAPSVAPVHYFAHPGDEHVTALELEDPAITLHQWQGTMISHVRRVKEDYKRLDWKKLRSYQVQEVSQ